jgi:NitT/TauT family transport system substrate-binding protein
VNRNPKKAVPAALLAMAMLATACGGDDDEAEPAGDGEETEALTPITVGILPLAGLAPLWYGVEEGYFEEEGLDVSFEIGQGGAQLAPSVLNDEYQFAIGEYMSIMQARENDVPIQVFSNLTNGADAPDQGINALLVAPDSGIAGVDDLAGKTFAVNGLNGVEDVAIRAFLDEHGVDSSGIDFVEIPFPDMNAAVESGEVDVASQPEPFVTLGEQAGLVNVLDPFYEALPSLPLGLIFASEAWLDDNLETAEAFDRALERSIEASSDEAAMREAIVANTDMEAELVDEIALDHWSGEVDTTTLATLAELAVKYGALEEEPDLDSLVWTAG